jgi:hypothetical protein
MKSRPILFTGEMVRAILDGRKTQTRRGVDRLAKIGPVTEFRRSDTPGYAWCARDRRLVWNDLRHDDLLARCPFGQPGDRLWVRERTRVFDFPGRNNLEVTYEADGARAVVPWPDRIKEPGIGQCLSMGCYREASRITLEVTAVRVERLTDISNVDAEAEGATHRNYLNSINGLGDNGWSMDWSRLGQRHRNATGPGGCICETDIALITARMAFANYVNAIRGAGTWESNPWVWVIEFRRVAP